MSWNAYGAVRPEQRVEEVTKASRRKTAALVAGLVVLGLTAIIALSLITVSRQGVEVLEQQKLVDVGTLGRTSSSSENVLGALAITQKSVLSDSENILGSLAITHSISAGSESGKKEAIVSTENTVRLRQKAVLLSAEERALKLKEAKVRAWEREDKLKYLRALRNARSTEIKSPARISNVVQGLDARTPANEIGFGVAAASGNMPVKDADADLSLLGGVLSVQAAPTSQAAKVAEMVLSAVEPELQKQQAEIARIADAVRLATDEDKEVSRTAADGGLRRGEGDRYRKVGRVGMSSLNMMDYNMNNDLAHGAQDPGIGAEPPLYPGAKVPQAEGLPAGVSWYSRPFKSPGSKGGPCSVSGACDHGSFRVRDSDYWHARFLKRYKPTVPRGDVDETREDLLVNPVGEARIPQSQLVGSGVFTDAVPNLPSNEAVVAIIGALEIEAPGAYTFCSPTNDTSFLYVDDRRAVTCRHVEGDTGERCGVMDLTRGKHTIKAALYGPTQAPAFNFTYSGADTSNEYTGVESEDGWIMRGYAAPPGAWQEWKGVTCSHARAGVSLGEEMLLRSLDDFVSPTEAYVHDLLTSGTYGFDHFGKLAPMSRENEELMYGRGFHHNVALLRGKRLHATGRGGPGKGSDKPSPLGEEQLGADDREVPVGISKGDFPGEDHDRFDHWKWNSNENQELLNGRYWRHLNKDGLMDRYTPADEAYARLKGADHDRHPVHDLFVGTWNLGTSFGSAEGAKSIVATDRRLREHPIGRTELPQMDWDEASQLQENISAVPDKNFAVVAAGTMEIVKAGEYLMCTYPTDPSMLYLDDNEVVYNDGSKQTCRRVELEAGEHSMRAVVFQPDPAGSFYVTYSGADTAAPGGKALNDTVWAVGNYELAAFHTTADVWSDWLHAHHPGAAGGGDEAVPWAKARAETQGQEWRGRVFTGTHESIEGQQGVVAKMPHDGAYF